MCVNEHAGVEGFLQSEPTCLLLILLFTRSLRQSSLYASQPSNQRGENTNWAQACRDFCMSQRERERGERERGREGERERGLEIGRARERERGGGDEIEREESKGGCG